MSSIWVDDIFGIFVLDFCCLKLECYSPMPSSLMRASPLNGTSEFLGVFALFKSQATHRKRVRERHMEWTGDVAVTVCGASHLNYLAPGCPNVNLIILRVHISAKLFVLSFSPHHPLFLDILLFVLVVTCFTSHFAKHVVLCDPSLFHFFFLC